MSGAKKSGPPEAGSSVTVRVDQMFAEDLATLAQAGMNTTDAVRWAANVMANCVTVAWRRGVVPVGTIPYMETDVYAKPGDGKLPAPPEAEEDTPRAA